MSRLVVLPLVTVAVSVGVVACSSDDGEGLSTLPTIRTTTTTTTTTDPVDERIRIYTVKEGENLSMIAQSFQVPLNTLIEWNADRLPDPNNVQPGVTLEIPPVVLIEELPAPESTPTEEDEP